MKENKEVVEQINLALKYLNEAKRLLEEEKETRKTIEIRIKKPFKEIAEFDTDDEIEKLRKELEEIMNDFTGE